MGSCEPGAKSFSTSSALWVPRRREVAAPGERGGRQGQDRVSPACVHGGEGEGRALEEEDHEEPLAGWAVPYALAVLTGLGRQNGRVGLPQTQERCHLAGWALASCCPAAGAGHNLSKGPVRALDWRLRGRERAGSWALPPRTYLRAWTQAKPWGPGPRGPGQLQVRGGPKQLFSK